MEIILWEEVMPLVKIEIIKGKSLEYKKTVLDAVHVALENAIQIENWGLAGICNRSCRHR